MSKGTGHGGQATVEEQIDAIGIGKLQILAYVATFCFVIADGMELIVTNLTFRALPHEWGLDVSARGYLISTSMLGFVVGGLLGGYFADLVGRKTMFYVHAIIFLPFTCASGLSSSFYMLLVSRLFVGFSMGIVLPTSVAYMAEVLPTEWRGRLVASLVRESASPWQTLAHPGIRAVSKAGPMGNEGPDVKRSCDLYCMAYHHHHHQLAGSTAKDSATPS